MILSQYIDKYFFSKRLCTVICCVITAIGWVTVTAYQRPMLPPMDQIDAFLQPWLRNSESQCLSGIPKASTDLEDFDYSFQADRSDIKLSSGESRFEGNVFWHRDDDILRTDKLVIERDKQGEITQWDVPGRLSWSNNALHMQAKSATFAKETGYSAKEILFLIFGDHQRRLWGWSENMKADDVDNISFYNIFMSSCTPDAMGWHIESPEVKWDADIQRLRMMRPRFYYFNTYLFSLNYYDVYMRKIHHVWSPKLDYMNGMFRFGVQYQEQYARWQWFPYVNSRGNPGLQVTDFYRNSSGYSKGEIDVFYKFDKKDVLWRLYHRGLYHLTYGDLDWHLLWKNNANTASATDESIRPNQSLANHFRWSRKDATNHGEIGLYWYKRFLTTPKWTIDANGLANYDRFPHLYYLHSPAEGLTWGMVYDNLVFLANSEDVPTASRALTYLGYSRTWTLLDAIKFQTSYGGWYSMRHLYDDDNYPKNRSVVVPKAQATLWFMQEQSMDVGVDYTYVMRNTKQLDGPIFTQNRWYWRDNDWDILKQVDVISDKNDLNLFVYWPSLMGLDNWQLKLSHALLLADHRIFLSSTGDEDPQVHYKNKVSYGMLRRADGKAKLEGLWNWATGKWHTVHLHLQHEGWQFYWLEEPGLLLLDDTTYDFSHARLFGMAYPLYKKGYHYLYAKLNYTDNANKNLYYKVGWEYTSCCMQLAVEVSKNQIITGDNLQKYRWPAVLLRLSATGW